MTSVDTWLTELERKSKLVSDLQVRSASSVLGMRRIVWSGGQVLLVQSWNEKPRDEQEATLDAFAEFLVTATPDAVLALVKLARRTRG